MFLGQQTRAHFAAPLLLALALQGCAIIPHSGRASTGIAPVSGSFRLAATEQPTEDEAMARKEVARLLKSRGLTESDQAEREVEVTLSRRPTTLAIATSADGPKPEEGGTIDAKTRVQHILPLCKDAVIRLSVAMIDVTSGSVIYRAQAEDRTCRKVSRGLVQELGARALSGQ
jgi:hypothetical protein